MSKTKQTLLIIEPEKSQRNGLAFGLNELFDRVIAVPNPAEAMRILKNQSVDIIVTEYHFPMSDGKQVLKKLNHLAPNSRILIITVQEQFKAEEPGLRQFEVLSKPVDIKTLKTKLIN